MHFRESKKSNLFGKRVGGGGDVPKPPTKGTSVSTLTVGNATLTAKHFENTDILPLREKNHLLCLYTVVLITIKHTCLNVWV